MVWIKVHPQAKKVADQMMADHKRMSIVIAIAGLVTATLSNIWMCRKQDMELTAQTAASPKDTASSQAQELETTQNEQAKDAPPRRKPRRQ